MICIKRVASITALKAGITKEDALHDLSEKFILARSEYVCEQNKCTRKHAEGDRKEVDQEREENEEHDHSVQKMACD